MNNTLIVDDNMCYVILSIIDIEFLHLNVILAKMLFKLDKILKRWYLFEMYVQIQTTKSFDFETKCYLLHYSVSKFF